MAKPITLPSGKLGGTQDPAWLDAHHRLKGRLPDELTQDDFRELGHDRPILAATRQNCLECANGSPAEVRSCEQTWCPMWPFRMGTNPHHRKNLTDEQRAEAGARLKRGREKAQKAFEMQRNGGAADAPATPVAVEG